MKLYHYVHGKRTVYDIDPGVSIEQAFKETNTWPGVRFILVKG